MLIFEGAFTKVCSTLGRRILLGFPIRKTPAREKEETVDLTLGSILKQQLSKER